MNKIEWENYQDGDSTPLSAENLNLMQDNIEEELGKKADKLTTYTKSEVDTELDLKADKLTTYTKSEVDSELNLKADKTEDTGWINISLNAGISTGSMGQTPQYRKIGNKVEIRGDVAFTASSSTVYLANSLPANIRPNSNQYFMSSLGETRIMRFGMSTSGNIFIDWVFNLTGTQMTSGNINWAQINLTFYTD